MKSLRWILSLSGVGLVCLLALPIAHADPLAWRTTLRLSEPTEIPGKVLPVGDYVIKVVNTKETRSIVQFLDSTETQVVATVLAVPDYRVKTAEDSQFIYFERSAGSRPALKSWVYQGNNFGVEFVYSKQEALVLAEQHKEVVYATPATEPALDAPVVVVTPEKKEVPLETYQAQAPVTPPATVVAERHEPTLPKTGSNLPLIGMIGAISLLGAAGIRIFVRG